MRKEVEDIVNYARYLIKGNTNRIPMINMLIYYSQYLSIEDRYIPLLWSNFFNINNIPYLSAIIAEPKVDYSELSTIDIEENTMHYMQKALEDIANIHKQFGFDGVKQFINGICDIQGRPSVNPYGMLFYILKDKDKIERNKAYKTMGDDESNKKYTKIVIDEEEKEIECTKYAAQ